MGHSVGDAAARSVKKSEKQAEKANRTPEQRVSDIRKLAEAGLAVHTADVMFLLGEYDKLREKTVMDCDKILSDYGVELLDKGDNHGWGVLDDVGHKLRATVGRDNVIFSEEVAAEAAVMEAVPPETYIPETLQE